jgi:3-deoxy-manno-octulosonate cytidylyltransferase (CMP-KDO synthetase)
MQNQTTTPVFGQIHVPALAPHTPKKAGKLTSYIVIPARLNSTRLARKMLLRETGKTLLQHTFEAAKRARKPQGVCIATDHEEIAAEVRAFGGEVVMTSPECASGTDRIAEVARAMPDVDLFVNVQGDEPEMNSGSIDRVIELLEEHPDVPMSTVAAPLRRKELLNDPACVKAAFAGKFDAAGRWSGRALYFSRSPIPHAREWDDSLLTANPPSFFHHLGLYAYRREFLDQFTRLARSPLETLESLEQLRVLEAGYTIWIGLVEHASSGIDTPADYAAFVERMRHTH